MSLKTKQNCAGPPIGYSTVIVFGIVSAMLIGVSADICVDRVNGWRYQDASDCHGFFVCIKNISYQAYCDYGEKFDVDSRRCVKGKCPPCETCNSQCGSSTPSTPSTKPTSATPTVPWNSCHGHSDGSVYGDVYDCTKFYFCVGGKEFTAHCTGNTYFDKNLHACYDADMVDCVPVSTDSTTSSSTKAPTTTPSTTTTIWPLDPYSCEGRPNSYIFRDPKNCATFYYCIDGIKKTNTCPDGEYFDTNMNACRESNDVDCPSDATTTTTTLVPTTTTIRPLDSCEGRPNGYIFGDPKDCARFYYCRRGIRKAYTCPNGLYFDSNLNKCMISRDVYCPSDPSSSSTKGPTSSTTATLWPIDPACYGRPDGYIFRDSYDCATFHYCIDGIKKTDTCPNGELFDTSLNACIESNDVDCPSTTSSTTTTTTLAPTTTNRPLDSCEGRPNGYIFGDPKDCARFYYCRRGIRKAYTCPNGLYFDSNLNKCMISRDVYCPSDPSSSSTKGPTSSTTATLWPIDPACYGRPDGYIFRDSYDCATFHYCIDGIKKTDTCPNGELFDTSLNACIESNDVDCPSTTSSTTTTTTLAPTTTNRPLDSCEGRPNGYIFGDPKDCARFYYCRRGIRKAYTCPNGLYFDSNLNKCMISRDVYCPSDPSSSSTKGPTSSTTATLWPIDPACYGRPDGYIFRDSYDCATFHYCIDGIKKTDTCPNGELFDTSMNACIESNDVDCPSTTSSTTTTTTLAPTTTNRPLDSCEGRPNGYIFGDPKDCARFYYCRRGIRKAYTCPNGLYFDSNLNKCMISRDVYCPSDPSSSSTKGPTSSTTATLWPIDPACYGRPDGYIFRDSYDCATFHYCIDGIKKTDTCPNGELFDTSLNACIESNDVDCPSTTSSTTTTTTLAPTTTTSTTTTTTLAPTTTTTLAPTTTSPTKTTTTTTTTVKDHQVDPNVKDCLELPNGSFFRNKDHCRIYYVCRDGEAVKHSCAPNQWFNDIHPACNLREFVRCAAGVD